MWQVYLRLRDYISGGTGGLRGGGKRLSWIEDKTGDMTILEVLEK